MNPVVGIDVAKNSLYLAVLCEIKIFRNKKPKNFMTRNGLKENLQKLR